MHAVLVPGLFSPRWMMLPMAAYLRRRLDRVTAWDHPTVFGDMDRNVRTLDGYLSEHLGDRRPAPPVALVTHSFGDWITRRVLQRRRYDGRPLPTHLVSIGPVVTSNPASAIADRVVGGRITEIAIMADEDLASESLVIPPSVAHLALWPRIDPWIRRSSYRSPQTIERRVWASHNSALFQPGVMRTVGDFLASRTVAPPTVMNVKRRVVEMHPAVGGAVPTRGIAADRYSAAG